MAAGAFDSAEFFRRCGDILHWSDLAGKTVMDIGCGNGENSTKTFMELYPNVAKIIAIDNNRHLIDYAQQESQHPKIEYHVVDIQQWSSLSQWEGQIHVIVSYYCFHSVDDSMKAFENVHRLLAPGGTAAIVYIMKADFYDWALEVGEMYRPYARNCQLDPPVSHTSNLFAFDIQPDIARIGFDTLHSEDEHHQIQFPTDEDCKSYLCAVCCLTPQIPGHLMDRFREDIFNKFLEYRPRNDGGLSIFRYRVAKFLIKKRE